MEDRASCVAASPIGKQRVQNAEEQAQPLWPQANKDKSTSVRNPNYHLGTTVQDQLLITEDFYDYEENGGIPGIKVRGRLLAHIQFWYNISAPQLIQDTIRFGYALPFVSHPPKMSSRNNKSALSNSSFVEQAITELVNLGTVERCTEQPEVPNPLTVSVPSNGKKHLILDLRLVNDHLEKVSVKYEDMRTAMFFLRKGGFMFKFDLKSGYHHIDICPAIPGFCMGYARILVVFQIQTIAVRSFFCAFHFYQSYKASSEKMER